MPGMRVLKAVAALGVALLSRPSSANPSYAKLEAGKRCSDFRVAEVPSKEECFNAAAAAVSISPAVKIQIDGVGFNGCALNTMANVLIYSVTPTVTTATHVVLPTLQYLCDGVPTTTVTATTTATSATSTTTSGIYAKLGPGSRCSDEGVPDVASAEACFEAARPLVGLGGTGVMELNNIGFSGCVFNSAAGITMFGVTEGVTTGSNMKLPTFEYVCGGIPTTTTTTTATLTTTTRVYTRLTAGQRCGDHHMPAVASKEACFSGAANAAGLTGKMTVEVNFMGFTGCVYNSIAGMLMYGFTPGITPTTTMALPTFEYICDGAPTILP